MQTIELFTQFTQHWFFVLSSLSAGRSRKPQDVVEKIKEAFKEGDNFLTSQHSESLEPSQPSELNVSTYNPANFPLMIEHSDSHNLHYPNDYESQKEELQKCKKGLE